MEQTTQSTTDAAAKIAEFKRVFNGIKEQINRVFVGHEDLVRETITAFLAGGHILLEGVPGLGKTLLARTLSESVKLKFSRIQFVPDLMPADIIGTTVFAEDEHGGHRLTFREGPLVANFILADEINRASPKTQSALLEAMQEQQISVGDRTIALPQPFTVIATQNPIEQEGTYPLPEAELDRFMIKVNLPYPREDEYHQILERTVGIVQERPDVVADGETVLHVRRAIREVVVSRQVQTYAVRLTMATQPGSPYAIPEVHDWVILGAGPRAAQALLLIAKAYALLAGRPHVAIEDIRAAALPVLRHRITLNFEARAHKKSADEIINLITAKISELSA